LSYGRGNPAPTSNIGWPKMERRQLLKKAKRIVVKIGTALLTTESGVLNKRFVGKLAREVTHLKEMGMEVILVSSGAVGAGMLATQSKTRPRTIPAKQAMAAIGQPKLMQAYADCFKRLGIMTSQILLTSEDINHRQRYSNARNAIFELLKMNVIPIVNENDTVAVKEIKFGDNDELSAQVTNLTEADALVILTDVNGLYSSDPNKDSSARLIHQVERINQSVSEMANTSNNELGTGGMITKIEAAKKVTKMGEELIIANGKLKDVLPRIMAGEEIGTIFYPQADKQTAKKRWIAYSLKPKGKLVLDKGAVRALKEGGKSLLPSGIKSTSDDVFQQGDCVALVDEKGVLFAHGLVKYTSAEIEKLLGKKSSEIQKILGFKNSDEIIHRDDMALV
jgi:glutamate 5-kinase